MQDPIITDTEAYHRALENHLRAKDKHLSDTVYNAGHDLGTLHVIIDDIGPEFWLEFMKAFQAYGSQHLTNELLAETLTGMLDIYNSAVHNYAENTPGICDDF